MSEFFDSVLANGTLTAPKPDARAFVELSAAVGHSSDEVVYVGDDPHWDALAATAAGLRGVWLNREDRVGPEGIHTEVRTLDALAPAIQAWNRPIS
ncbi:phosphoglycolate phosphatase [mine drainage metagenome]|uniref:Phosphoglycolate phosphatase n=1 Tax=mine drainage metagenome TaxID=410659 RepID=A0A1J5PYD3_9ZZZZ